MLHDGVFGIHGAQSGSNLAGQHYMHNRIYDINTGRWTTPDPAASPWSNLQDYVGGNPISRSDPSGMEAVWTDATNPLTKNDVGRKSIKLEMVYHEHLSTYWNYWMEYKGGTAVSTYYVRDKPCYKCTYYTGGKYRWNVVKIDSMRTLKIAASGDVLARDDNYGKDFVAAGSIAAGAAGTVVGPASPIAGAVISLAGIGMSTLNDNWIGETRDVKVRIFGKIHISVIDTWQNWVHFEYPWENAQRGWICEDIDCNTIPCDAAESGKGLASAVQGAKGIGIKNGDSASGYKNWLANNSKWKRAASGIKSDTRPTGPNSEYTPSSLSG